MVRYNFGNAKSYKSKSKKTAELHYTALGIRCDILEEINICYEWVGS